MNYLNHILLVVFCLGVFFSPLVAQHRITYGCEEIPETGEVIFHTNEDGIFLIEHNYFEGEHGDCQTTYHLEAGNLKKFVWTYTTWSMADLCGVLDGEAEELGMVQEVSYSEMYYEEGKRTKTRSKIYSHYDAPCDPDRENVDPETVPFVEYEGEVEGEKTIDFVEKLLGLAQLSVEETDCIRD